MELGTLRMTLRRPDEDDADVTTDDATVDMLFNDNVESGDEDDEVLADTTSPSILETWDPEADASEETDIEEAQEAEVPAFTMLVTGPTGAQRRFIWQADDGPAQEVFDDGFGEDFSAQE